MDKQTAIALTLEHFQKATESDKTWWAQLTDEQRDGMRRQDQYLASSHIDKLFTAIECKDIQQLRATLHTGNKMSRQIFCQLTGVELPPTEQKTIDTLREWVGPEVWDQWHTDREAERQAKIDKIQAEEAAKHAAYIDTIAKKLSASQSINGSELVDLCKALEVELHPRSIGMFRKRIRWIDGQRASIIKNGNVDSAFKAYRSCQSKLASSTT